MSEALVDYPAVNLKLKWQQVFRRQASLVNCIISARPHHCDVDVQESFQTGWVGELVRGWWVLSSHPLRPGGPWLCSHLPRGTSRWGHTQNQRPSERKALYLSQVQRCLFAPTPIKPFLAAPRPMFPLLNSWDAELLAAPVRSHFQSVPPQRKRSLPPSSPPTSQKCSQCCHFFTDNPVWGGTPTEDPCELGCLCRCWFPFVESRHWEQTEGCFHDGAVVRLDRN